ncbi:MAG: peroxide stress protein YaaA [Salibacteraceae bacterium]
MITLISPAKTLDFETELPDLKSTDYLFQEESAQIMKKLKSLSRKKISDLMSLSSSLADTNYQRFQMWDENPEKNAVREAVFMFKGEVYLGLDPISLSSTQLDFAQSNLRILSGLYGYLKPLDKVQAYRLEMGTKISIGRKKNLYEFWGEKISDAINEELNRDEKQCVLNLASNEYSKAANVKSVKGKVITPVFKDYKNGKFKVISFFAKKARGVMARWIIQNEITDSNDVVRFNEDGYSFNELLSSDYQPVFTRE